MYRESLQLSTRGCNEPVLWKGCLAIEDIQHQGYTFRTEHVVAICRYLNLEFRALILWNFTFGVLILDSRIV